METSVVEICVCAKVQIKIRIYGFSTNLGSRQKEHFRNLIAQVNLNRHPNLFRFYYTCLPVVFVVDTTDEVDSTHIRLLLFESRFGDNKTFCTPDKTANVDSFVVVLT